MGRDKEAERDYRKAVADYYSGDRPTLPVPVKVNSRPRFKPRGGGRKAVYVHPNGVAQGDMKRILDNLEELVGFIPPTSGSEEK